MATAPATPTAPTSGGVFQSSFDSATVSIQVDWAAPANNGAAISGYKLYKAQGASGFSLVYDGTGRSDLLSYTHTNVNRGESYTYKVLAINVVGESALSPSVTILAAVAPSTPQNFAITTSGASTIDVEWTAPEYDGGSPLTGYYGYHKLASAPTFTKSALIDPATTTYQFSGTVDNEYIVKVVAVNSEDESDPSDSIY